jgi:hypothetical protein
VKLCKRLLTFLRLLLLFAGDVHLNPGPLDGNIFLCHLNTRSLIRESDTLSDYIPYNDRFIKLDEIYHCLAYNNKADIITVSESWLDDTISDIDIELADYEVHRKDRTRHGGGVLAYVHNSLAACRRIDLENENVECLWLDVQITGGKLLIGTYYRPPGADAATVEHFMTSLQATVDIAFRENPTSIFLLGDFNDKCTSFNGSHDDSELRHKLFDFVNLNNLHQLITDPTRVTRTCSSLLDLIITDSPGYLLDSGTLPPLYKMDHCIVFCKVCFKTNRGNSFSRKIYSYNNGDFIALRHQLSLVPWNIGLETFDDINDIVYYWQHLFMESIDDFIPNKIILVRPKDKEWMTPNIRRLIKKRDRLYRRFSRTGSHEAYDVYIETRSDTRHAIDVAKNEYYMRLVIRLRDPTILAKEYFKISKRLYRGKCNLGIPAVIENGVCYADSKLKADIFNDYYASNSSLGEPSDGFALPPLWFRTDSRISTVLFSPVKVYEILKKLDISKANGPDQISNRMLKETAEVIAEPLANVFNKCIETSSFPLVWKRANIVPIYKKHDKQLKENYRPISLLSCVGKVMERIMFCELYEY